MCITSSAFIAAAAIAFWSSMIASSRGWLGAELPMAASYKPRAHRGVARSGRLGVGWPGLAIAGHRQPPPGPPQQPTALGPEDQASLEEVGIEDKVDYHSHAGSGACERRSFR